MRRAAATALVFGLWAGSAHAAGIVVTPRVALVDRAVDIRATGLAPGAKVLLEAVQPADPRGTWIGKLTLRAKRDGVADAGRAGMRLFWDASGDWSTFPALGKPVRLTASVGGKIVAHTTLVRRAKQPGVRARRLTLAHDDFVGTYYTPPHRTTKPAVLFLSGSNGGERVLEPELLASHGIPTLSLAYFREPGLPQHLVRIPLEYFRTALGWLAKQPGVDPRTLTVLGISRGSEAALLLGGTYPSLVHRVAAIVPSSVVNCGLPATTVHHQVPAWTLNGKPVPCVPSRDWTNPNPPDAQDAVIQVEKIAGPIFLAAGVVDGVWPSVAYADAIAARLRAHGRPAPTLLEYADSGHNTCGVPYLPDEVVFGTTNLGGTRADNAAAQADCWPKLVAWLDG